MARYSRRQRRDNLTFVQASATPAFGGRKLTSEGRVFYFFTNAIFKIV
jgi:hypothetical protein